MIQGILIDTLRCLRFKAHTSGIKKPEFVAAIKIVSFNILINLLIIPYKERNITHLLRIETMVLHDNNPDFLIRILNKQSQMLNYKIYFLSFISFPYNLRLCNYSIFFNFWIKNKKTFCKQ